MVPRFPYAIYCYIMPAFCLFLLLTCLKLKFPLSGIFVCFFLSEYTLLDFIVHITCKKILRITIEIKNDIPFPICPCVFLCYRWYPIFSPWPNCAFFMASNGCGNTSTLWSQKDVTKHFVNFISLNLKNEKTFS